jgi:hypothetical protein
LDVLFGLLLGTFFLALLGHGIWVLMAAIGRAIFGGDAHPASPPGDLPTKRRHECPICTAEFPTPRASCEACGWPFRKPAEPDRRRLALEALARLAARFRRTGWLDPQSYELVDRALAESQSATEPAQEAALAPETLLVAPLPLETAPLEPRPLQAEPSAPEPPPAEFVAPLPLPSPVHEAMPEPDRDVAPHRPFAKILASFLEEKNIRWGELIGGLLIICSSIALVLSFWQDISQTPWVKFGLFNGVTAVLFGIGLYIERRWRLPTTTHGILLIAVLLVPLNFLAIAAFTLDSAPVHASPIVGELLSIALFAGLTFAAGRILVGPAAWWFAAGVVGASAWELVVRRFAEATSSTETLLALGLPAVLCFATPTAYWARRLDRTGDSANPESATFGEPEANRLFNITGATFFAALLPLAILLAKTGHVAQTLTRIAPIVSLLGAPLVAVGLVLWRRLTAPELMKERVAGTTIAVAGAMAMLAAVGLGWPMPAGMLPTALINTFVFVWIGVRCGIPAAHLPAALCLAAAYLLGFHVVLGNIAWHGADPRTTLAALLSAGSGTALVAPAVLSALAAILFGRRSEAGERREGANETAKWYSAAAGIVAVASICLITYYAFRTKDGVGATFVYALYAVGAIAAAMRTGQAALGYIGSGLLGFAILQGLFRYGGDGTAAEGWSVAMLLHATISLVAMRLIVAFTNRRRADESLDTKPYDGAATPLFTGAVVSSVLAVPTLIVLSMVAGLVVSAAIFWTWLALIWGVVAWWLVSPRWLAFFQAAGYIAATQWVSVSLQGQPWLEDLQGLARVSHLRVVTLHGFAAAGLCGAWVFLRLVLRRSLNDAGDSRWAALRNHAARLVYVSRVTVDRVVLGLLTAIVVLIACCAITPGVSQELAPRQAAPGPVLHSATPGEFTLFEFDVLVIDLSHGRAYADHVWAMWAAVVAVVLLGMSERFARRRLLGLILLTTAASMLVAARWETENATASALRWTSVFAFLFLSLPLWFRSPTVAMIDRLGWPGWTQRPSNLARHWFGWSLGLSLAPVLTTTFAAIAGAFSRTHVHDVVADAWWGSLAFAIGSLFFSAILGASHRSPGASAAGESWSLLGARLAGLAGVAPLAAVVLYAIAAAFDASPIVGPMPTSEFARMGSVVSYTTPLWILAAAFVVHAWLGASAPLAFSASLLLNLGATIAYLLIEAKTGLKFDAALWLRLGQLNAAVSGAFAIAWMIVVPGSGKARWVSGGADDEPTGDTATISSWVTTQAALGAALFTPVILGPLGHFFQDLYDPARVPLAAADKWAWGSFTVVLIAALMWFRVVRQPISIAAWSLSALAIVSLDALSRIARPTPPQGTGELVTLDRLVAGWLIIAFALAAVGFKAERRGWAFGPARSVIRWSTFIGFAAFVAAQHGLVVIVGRSMFNSGPLAPHGFLSSVAFLVAVLCAGLAGWGASRWRLYEAALLATYAATVVWFDRLGARLFPGTYDSATVVLFVMLIAWSLPTPLWLAIERRFIIPRSSRRAGDVSLPVSSQRMEQRRHSRLPILSQTTGVTSLVLMTLAVATGLLRDLAQEPHEMHPWLYGATMLSVLLAAATSLWDAGSKKVIGLLYIAGLTTIGAALDISFAINQLDTRMLFWLGTMFASAYALGTSYLWSVRSGLRKLAAKLQMPTTESQEEQESAAGWLVAANYALAVLVVVAAYRVILVYDSSALRMSAAHAVFGAAAAVALLAQGARRSSLQLRTLEFGWVGAIAAGWAVIAPGETWEFLNRATLAVAATAMVVALYGLGFAKLLRKENDWTAAAVRLVPRLIVVAGVGLGVILCGEVYEYVEFGAVAIGPTAIGAVLAALVGLAAAAIMAAVVPGRDPLGMNESGRMRYVYGAEIILALTMLHVRLTMPWLFSGFWLRYWPVLVMLLAFVGVGLGEVFRRRSTNVLAEPLEKTGAFLPLLPVVGFWMTKTDVHYSLLLLAVGLLYSTLAVMRKSFGFGILAALAANGGLWYFLAHQEGLGWLEHPQLWLIPPALCVLIAAHLNRHRLTEEQATAYRYGAATTIYVASTADVFLNGVAEAPLLPLWLAALSIAGIFAGIALRVRAFLFLGTAFLLLALMTIIWHAAYDLEQTWIFYVTGIVAGTLIIALFAVFEKKRQEILAVVEKLRDWDA